MRRELGLMALAVLVALPAAAQKVTIDYAHDFDFSTVKTFRYVEPEPSKGAGSLMDQRIKAAITRELTQGGLTEVTENPDIDVTYHVATQDKTVYSTTNLGYGGYGPGWHRWGMGMGTSRTTASTYTDGTLIIDAYTPQDKRLIWRGTGTVTVKDNPEKRSKQVDKILAKLGARWDKILANQGK